MPGGQQELFVEILQNFRDACRQIVVEQNRARVEILESQAIAATHQGFEQQRLPIGQFDRRRFGNVGQERAEANIQTGQSQDVDQTGDVLQIEGIARVVFRNQQHAAGIRADFLDGDHRRLNAQRDEIRIEIVEATGKEVHVDRCQLESGIPQIDRAVERRRVILPFSAQPAFDLWRGLQEAVFDFKQGTGQGSCQMRNHRRREEKVCRGI